MKKLIQRLLFGEVQGEPIGLPNPRTINAVSANLYEVQPYITPTQQGIEGFIPLRNGVLSIKTKTA